MKKIIYFIALIAVCMSLMSCAAESTNTDIENKGPVSQVTEVYDSTLLNKLDQWVNITQPGTAGTSLKTVAAVKDMIIWAQENTIEKETVAATIVEYLKNCEYKDEATDAFISMENVFDKIADGTISDLIDGMEFEPADFETDAKAYDNIRMVFDAIEAYINPQE